MRFRLYALIALSVIAIAVCVRLGMWQLNRLHERLAYNTVVAARLMEAPVAVQQLTRDTAQIMYRRVLVQGVYDYDHEVVLTNRTRNGSPGVNILTPLRLPGTDTAVLVNRGWVYAPDGTNVDLAPWREEDSLTGEGYVLPAESPGGGSVRSASRANAYRWVDFTALREAIPYPLLPFTVLLAGDTITRSNVPPRVPPPVLDEGPHRSYAFQWFSFAVVFLIGTIVFVLKSRKSDAQK
jgi:surfeit locus 1 family protein